MPEPNTLSGGETGSPENGTESGKYSADVQKVIDELTAKAAKAETERKKANEEAAAYRLKEKEAADKKAIENGEAAKIVESLTKELEETKSLTAAQKAKLDKVEADRRKELLSRLPQDKVKNYEGIELSVLELIAKDFAVEQPSGNSQGGERGGGNGGVPLTLEGMNQTQLLKLMNENPEAYKKLMDSNKGK